MIIFTDGYKEDIEHLVETTVTLVTSYWYFK